ncbi:MAG: coenzyme F420-0:L-glutamate ligase [Candidatus Komeilibacteria bacterium]|nr:coenzyme F420-0:L-glutamate ligase [Candidatus Komeilibacteria bacterium]
MKIIPIKTKIFQEGENLFRFIITHCPKLSEQSVLVITSKIVALAEKRTAIIKNSSTKEKLIRQESQSAIKTPFGWLTIKDNVPMMNAGVDESNANGKIIMLPKNSFKTASELRTKLKKYYKIIHLGIIVTDSRTLPLHSGIAGVALGYSGFRGLKDYRGTKDLFGRIFHFSRTNIADSLATAAVLTMGEGNEQQPLAIIEAAPIQFCNRTYQADLKISIQDDMYRPLFLIKNKK